MRAHVARLDLANSRQWLHCRFIAFGEACGSIGSRPKLDVSHSCGPLYQQSKATMSSSTKQISTRQNGEVTHELMVKLQPAHVVMLGDKQRSGHPSVDACLDFAWAGEPPYQLQQSTSPTPGSVKCLLRSEGLVTRLRRQNHGAVLNGQGSRWEQVEFRALGCGHSGSIRSPAKGQDWGTVSGIRL